MWNRMDEGLRVRDRALLHQVGPELAREVELDVDLERLGNVDAAIAALGRVVELAQRRVPGAGIVPGIGALLGRAVERLDHFDVQGRLELLEKHRQGGAHDAGADEDDIGLRGGAISNHEVPPPRTCTWSRPASPRCLSSAKPTATGPLTWHGRPALATAGTAEGSRGVAAALRAASAVRSGRRRAEHAGLGEERRDLPHH